MKNFKLILIIACTVLISSCRDEIEVIPETTIPIPINPQGDEIIGLYLLNEGNMGSNKSTLDYIDYTNGKVEYIRNIYASRNPTVVKELGDVGNDIGIYGSKLYAVINCSNKIEVMEKYTAKRIGQINIPNCRYIKFHEGYAYVTSYAGPVIINPDYDQLGYVAKIDTSTLQVIDRCLVGFQPDELEIVNNKIYVANSGGYMYPNYENTVSVIDIPSFIETKRIKVANNLHRLCADQYNQLWVSSRGDYYGQLSRLYMIDLNTDLLVDSLDIAVSNFHLDGDSLYIYSTEWSYLTMSDEVTYGIVNVSKKEIVTRNFITDGNEKKIKYPYGITVHPESKDIYITDAKNKVKPGALYCFDKEGKMKIDEPIGTGDIPAHFVFVTKD